MTLNEVMKETADAIREKTGKSELIKPVDFAEEIKGISAGGGESASTIEYFNFRNLPNGLTPQNHALIGKFDINGQKMVVPVAMLLSESGANTQYMIEGAIDLECEVIIPAMGITSPTKLKDIPGLKEAYESIPRITKEQFYDLNA